MTIHSETENENGTASNNQRQPHKLPTTANKESAQKTQLKARRVLREIVPNIQPPATVTKTKQRKRKNCEDEENIKSKKVRGLPKPKVSKRKRVIESDVEEDESKIVENKRKQRKFI